MHDCSEDLSILENFKKYIKTLRDKHLSKRTNSVDYVYFYPKKLFSYSEKWFNSAVKNLQVQYFRKKAKSIETADIGRSMKLLRKKFHK